MIIFFLVMRILNQIGYGIFIPADKLHTYSILLPIILPLTIMIILYISMNYFAINKAITVARISVINGGFIFYIILLTCIFYD
jgi:hypothetical protein